MKTYTYIGYYRDNGQPWMAHLQADKPNSGEALAEVVAKLLGLENAPELSDIVIVEAIEGAHRGVLSNERVVNGTSCGA